MVRFRVRFWAAWKRLVALGVGPGLHHLHRGGRDGLPGGLGGLDLHLGGGQGPRRQNEIRHIAAGLAGDDFRLFAHRLDVLAVHQHLHFHFLEALAHGVGDQPGDGQAVARQGPGRQKPPRLPGIRRLTGRSGYSDRKPSVGAFLIPFDRRVFSDGGEETPIGSLPGFLPKLGHTIWAPTPACPSWARSHKQIPPGGP